MPIALPKPRDLVGALRRGLSWAWRGETHHTFFDVFNPRELNPVLATNGVKPLLADAALAARGRDGAARFVLAHYAGSLRRRRRFPRAVAEDHTGPYCRRLIGELSGDSARIVEAVFASNYGGRVARIWEAHPDLREALPFALTPFERGKFLHWLLADARARYGFAAEEALWHLFELATDASCGLVRTYRYSPEWQEHVPDALTSAGWPKLKHYVGRRMGFVSRWLRRAHLSDDFLPSPPLRRRGVGGEGESLPWRRDLPPSPQPSPPEAGGEGVRAHQAGVNLLGYFRYTSGLQQVALKMAEALRDAGVATSCRDVPTQTIRDSSSAEALDGLEVFGTTIVNLPIDLRLGEVFHRAGLWLRPAVRRIASAWWELEQVPQELAGWAADYDEIWAPTRFIAEAIRSITNRQVRTMLPGLELPAIHPLPKAHFGLDPHAFTFLFVFDFNSRMPRKNPLGLIRAFRLAFKKSQPVQLVIKVSAGHQVFGEHRRVLHEVAEREGICIIDKMLTRSELLALAACCNCYVSLHRSEGFGLTIAEAMLLGKPAIATGYSGNLDFMTPENCRLVDFAKVPITDDIPPYPKGFLWAEPSIEHAAELMRWMYEHPAEARALGERGQRNLREVLSLAAYGRRLSQALNESEV